ncbi:hypothetical protein CC80DRAFT_134406 [Byssothecium circinans]|uniref:Uncharacterized protein n=1 Tax=Byssothecium circinans TaxID=147558 RepID=A0A6A5TNH6_9PLEO|nr:hypothetical protein CC80DRAFT_134406 [Byssothecium circinans]
MLHLNTHSLDLCINVPPPPPTNHNPEASGSRKTPGSACVAWREEVGGAGKTARCRDRQKAVRAELQGRSPSRRTGAAIPARTPQVFGCESPAASDLLCPLFSFYFVTCCSTLLLENPSLRLRLIESGPVDCATRPQKSLGDCTIRGKWRVRESECYVEERERILAPDSKVAIHFDRTRRGKKLDSTSEVRQDWAPVNNCFHCCCPIRSHCEKQRRREDSTAQFSSLYAATTAPYSVTINTASVRFRLRPNLHQTHHEPAHNLHIFLIDWQNH